MEDEDYKEMKMWEKMKKDEDLGRRKNKNFQGYFDLGLILIWGVNL